MCTVSVCIHVFGHEQTETNAGRIVLQGQVPLWKLRRGIHYCDVVVLSQDDGYLAA